MKKLIVFLFISGLFASSLFAQDGKLEFTQKKISDTGFTVYFHVVNITGDDHADQILRELTNDENVFEGRYFISNEGKDRYQLRINDFVTAEYVRNILLSQNVDYEYSTVTVDGYFISGDAISDSEAIRGSSKTYVSSLGFPKYEHTGDSEIDAINYKNIKDEWIQENPDEYDSMLEELKQKNQVPEIE